MLEAQSYARIQKSVENVMAIYIRALTVDSLELLQHKHWVSEELN
jgi:hypothetical protein